MSTIFTAYELDVIRQLSRSEMDTVGFIKLRGGVPDDVYVAHVATVGAKAGRMLQEMQEAAKAKEHSHEPHQQRAEQILGTNPDQRVEPPK